MRIKGRAWCCERHDAAADPGDVVDGAADGEEAVARFVEVVVTTAAEATATGCSIAARRRKTFMYDSYTSTVGQYRTYPLGFTYNGSV